MLIEFNDNEIKTLLKSLCFAGRYFDFIEKDDKEFKNLCEKIIMSLTKDKARELTHSILIDAINLCKED